MKFNCGPTSQEKHQAKHEWHDIFALLPTRVGDRDCRWLEIIQRKGIYYNPRPGCAWWEWEYRAKDNG